MIELYGVSYRMPTYVVASLRAITRTAGEMIRITVADNRSPKSPEIERQLRSMLLHGPIDRVIMWDQNIVGQALAAAIELFPPREPEPFFVATDLDVVPPAELRWVARHRQAFAEGLHLHGFSLDPINYVPPNSGFGEDPEQQRMGCYLLAIDRLQYLRRWRREYPFVDVQIAQVTSEPRRRDLAQLYHLGWDVWRDDPDYWAEKVKMVEGGGWLSTARCGGTVIERAKDGTLREWRVEHGP